MADDTRGNSPLPAPHPQGLLKELDMAKLTRGQPGGGSQADVLRHDRRVPTDAKSESIGSAAGDSANPVASPIRVATQRSLCARVLQALMKSLGSLQLAILLLAGLVVILLAGTLVESRYDQKTAHELVYGTGWFICFLGLLAANVFFAAVKKWPWRRHQTGFLITHIGLLMLVTSGLVSSLTGSHGLMLLVDSAEFADPLAVQTSNRVVNRRQDVVVVIDGDDEQAIAVSPGPFSWQVSGQASQHANSSHATPASQASWGGMAWDGEPPSIDGSDDSSVDSVTQRWEHPWWVKALWWLSNPVPRSVMLPFERNVTVEIVGYAAQSTQVPFRPAPVADRSTSGGNSAVPGMTAAVQLEFSSPATGTLPELWSSHDERYRRVPVGPAMVEFLGVGLGQESKEHFLQQDAPTRDLPDSGRAMLQVASSDEGQFLYRSFVRHPTEGWRWEKSGTCARGDTIKIWSGMQWRFRVKQWLPKAMAGPFIRPLDRGLLGDDAAAPPALHCIVRRGSDQQDVVIRRSDRQTVTTEVGGRTLRIGYRPQSLELDFAVMLLRAEQTTDPGTAMPASQSSHVMVVDPSVSKEPIYGVISMNEPMSHGGFSFYQSSLQIAGKDAQGKPVRRSALVVTRDPGIRLKYAGAMMVGLGIACMFYMRAYFFKPRPRARS